MYKNRLSTTIYLQRPRFVHWFNWTMVYVHPGEDSHNTCTTGTCTHITGTCTHITGTCTHITYWW